MENLFHKNDRFKYNIFLKSESSDEILNILASWAIMAQVGFGEVFYEFIFSKVIIIKWTSYPLKITNNT